ncbi:hypothetical protein K469DRAFT_593771, partial [Zopfia rhizophila CBS 207.26]
AWNVELEALTIINYYIKSTVVKALEVIQELAEDLLSLFKQAVSLLNVDNVRDLSSFINPVDEDAEVEEDEINHNDIIQHYTGQVGKDPVEKEDNDIVNEPIPSSQEALKAMQLVVRYIERRGATTKAEIDELVR